MDLRISSKTSWLSRRVLRRVEPLFWLYPLFPLFHTEQATLVKVYATSVNPMNFWGFFLQWQIHKSWNGRSLLDGDALHWRWKGGQLLRAGNQCYSFTGEAMVGQSILYPGLGHTGSDLLQGYGKLSGSSGQLFSHYFFLFIL